MPPTVRSLEERLDDFAEELGAVKSHLAVMSAKVELLANGVSATQAQLSSLAAQLAVVMAKFDGLTDSLKATNGRIDAVIEKLETMTADYTAFKSRADTTFALTKWVGAFVAGVFVTVLLGAFSVIRSAGNLESTVQQQQKTLDEIKHDLADIRSRPK